MRLLVTRWTHVHARCLVGARLYNTPIDKLSSAMSSDEFDAYDLSEFTSEEFAAIDARVARLLPSRAAVSRVEAVSAPIISAAAPLVHVVLESNPSLNASSCATDSNTTTRHRSPVADSPYKRFCSWKKAFAVTQLIGPVWCALPLFSLCLS